jgi:hypothetical protein
MMAGQRVLLRSRCAGQKRDEDAHQQSLRKRVFLLHLKRVVEVEDSRKEVCSSLIMDDSVFRVELPISSEIVWGNVIWYYVLVGRCATHGDSADVLSWRGGHDLEKKKRITSWLAGRIFI